MSWPQKARVSPELQSHVENSIAWDMLPQEMMQILPIISISTHHLVWRGIKTLIHAAKYVLKNMV